MDKGYREEIKRPPCANCGKEEGGIIGGSGWGHTYSCCSNACGERLWQRLENGMISHEQIKEKVEKPGFKHLFGFGEDENKTDIKLLRFRIKQLEHQLKENGIKPNKFPERR